MRLDAGSIGRRVRAQREQRGLTQEELALGIGITRAGVANIEAGRAMPSLPTAALLAQALGVKIDWLVSR